MPILNLVKCDGVKVTSFPYNISNVIINPLTAYKSKRDILPVSYTMVLSPKKTALALQIDERS